MPLNFPVPLSHVTLLHWSHQCQSQTCAAHCKFQRRLHKFIFSLNMVHCKHLLSWTFRPLNVLIVIFGAPITGLCVFLFSQFDSFIRPCRRFITTRYIPPFPQLNTGKFSIGRLTPHVCHHNDDSQNMKQGS